jgi:hypothetical protein
MRWAAQATLIYLPKYFPGLNPIELAFSKLKGHLRQGRQHAFRVSCVGSVATDFSAQECRNFFRHARYA